MSEGRTIGVKTSDSERRKWLKSLKVGDEVFVGSRRIGRLEVCRGRVVSCSKPLAVEYMSSVFLKPKVFYFGVTTGKTRFADIAIYPLSSRADEHEDVAEHLRHRIPWSDASLEALERVRDILKKEGLWSV
jgi:hypothetical protein